MGTTVVTGNFSADHPDTAVDMLIDQASFIRCVKTGPAAAGVKFRFRAKKRGATADTAIRTVFVAIQILAGKSGFSAFLAGDTILGFVKLATPFGVGFFDFWHVGFLEDYDSDRRCRK